MHPMQNPRILHRIYFTDMPPYRDQFHRYLDTWKREMPDYTIMHWNSSNLDLEVNEWVTKAVKARSPVFISEYFRWNVLQRYGGMYLDADCEIINGAGLHKIIDELYSSDDYDAIVGVEEFSNGFPTAQTVAAKPNSELVRFMVDMYENRLSPLWRWREIRQLIGPQLMTLYFWEAGLDKEKGCIAELKEPTVIGRVKVYPQEYFSPKFSLQGNTLRYTANTCVYHLFANLNINFADEEQKMLRDKPMLFVEYQEYLKKNRYSPVRFIKRFKQLIKIILRKLKWL